MNHQLTHMIAQQRSAELQRAGADARLTPDVLAGQTNPRHSKLIARLSLQVARVTGRFAPARPRYETGAETANQAPSCPRGLPYHPLNHDEV